MALNFNVDPYYDDFDPSKNYHRILFKPGYAVQARELTQSQTILQDQVTKFADQQLMQLSLKVNLFKMQLVLLLLRFLKQYPQQVRQRLMIYQH
jgi:hypothetical protein